MEVNTFG